MPPLTIHSLLPDPEALLALEPEELAGVVLQYLVSAENEGTQLNRYNFGLPYTVQEYPTEHHDRISKALMEAWMWLEHEGLLAPKPGTLGEWVFVTRRGRQVATPKDLERYRRGNLLPRESLHPRLAQKVWALFLRGDYDVAVFQAFKEVEVRVREAGGYSELDLGVDLMRKAFHWEDGPLTDSRVPKQEREALAHLFAGAIGLYKNPHSHRKVTIEPQETVEMITLASHLLGITDRRDRVSSSSVSRQNGPEGSSPHDRGL